jgi:hypothetical protein
MMAPSRFTPARVHFGRRPPDDFDDDGTGLPTPIRAKAAARRTAGIREAKQVLEHLPGPGESLHAIVTARLDLTDVVNALLETVGPCDRMRVATLGFNEKNLRTMLDWLDAGRVRSLALVASLFFRSHKGELWERTLAEFRARGQRAACCHSHAKVVSMSFAGRAFCIEGSANLCGNGSGREQFALFADADLTAWHCAWIDELIGRHGGTSGASE